MLKKAPPETVKALGKVLFRVAYREADGTSPHAAVAEYRRTNKYGLRVAYQGYGLESGPISSGARRMLNKVLEEGDV